MTRQRVIVIGTTCAGKSTFAGRLAEQLRVPLIELDELYWKSDWRPSERSEFRAKVDAETRSQGWVLAGSYLGLQQDISWPRADTVVWLDPSLALVVWRVLRRSFVRSWRRELLWGTNRERFLVQFKIWDEQSSLIAFALRHHRAKRRQYSGSMQDARWRHIAFHRFESPERADEWLCGLARA
jgi:adenylate kinase family enzyme